MKGLLRIPTILIGIGLMVTAALSAPKTPGTLIVFERTQDKAVMRLYAHGLRKSTYGVFLSAIKTLHEPYCQKYHRDKGKFIIKMYLDAPYQDITMTCIKRK